ncbi:MAG: NAD(P)H-hydrate dehydratase [Acidimicrobiia bacterium]
MVPIVTPEEMAMIDRDAPGPTAVLIERAGTAVAREALRLLGQAYGRRVVVVAGKGNNGNDGRAAAVRLRRRGAHVEVHDAHEMAPGTLLGPCDLVIDAAYGTGFRGEYEAPRLAPGTPVLAVDIPSGVDGLTGRASPAAVHAEVTVTFAAPKPGLVLFPGRGHAGRVVVADIGLDCSRARAHLVEGDDVARWLPRRRPEAHKWDSAVWVVAGSAGMEGAAILAARGAQRAGAGYVRLSVLGGAVLDDSRAPVEVVRTAVGGGHSGGGLRAGLDRFRAMVIGPGLGRDNAAADAVRAAVADSPVPVVVDGDGLRALGRRPTLGEHVVLTPHDGEFALLAGTESGPDRFAAARGLAAATGAVVLLKGPTTVVATPGGDVMVTTTGDSRLATAGTGDVLAGIIGALLAQGMVPARAAAAGAWLHGRAGHLGFARGLVAGDVADHLPCVLADLEASADGPLLAGT